MTSKAPPEIAASAANLKFGTRSTTLQARCRLTLTARMQRTPARAAGRRGHVSGVLCPHSFEKEHQLLKAVVGRLLRDDDVVDVRLLEARGADADEARLLLKLLD